MQYPSADQMFGVSSVIHSAAITAVVRHEAQLTKVAHESGFAHPYQHKTLHKVYSWMGPIIFCGAFHMTFNSYWHLHTKLLVQIKIEMDNTSD